MARPTPEDRFWSKVDKSGDCWLWTAYKTKTGYGQFGLDGKVEYVHRVVYSWLVGAIPLGNDIDHKCHVRHCVNPRHLRACTRTENIENLSGSHKNSTSKYLGVSWATRDKKWIARLKQGPILYCLGSYDDEYEAHLVVLAKRLELQTHNDKDRI